MPRSFLQQLLTFLIGLLVAGVPAVTRGGYVLCIGSDGHAHLTVGHHENDRNDSSDRVRCHGHDCCPDDASPAHPEASAASFSDADQHPGCVDLSVTSADRATTGKAAQVSAALSPLDLPALALHAATLVTTASLEIT